MAAAAFCGRVATKWTAKAQREEGGKEQEQEQEEEEEASSS